MRKITLLIFVFLSSLLNAQADCYSLNKYEYLDLNSGKVDFEVIKQPIGLCFTDNYVAINLNGKITTFPIQEVSKTKRRGSSGYLIYSFFTDKTSLYGIGYYNIEIVYGKTRKVVINNTVAGNVYVMEFKTTQYHYLQEKDFKNVDSLGKVATQKSKYKPSGMGDVALCKYCDGVVWNYGQYTYCGRCKKDTNGVSMYEIWNKK